MRRTHPPSPGEQALFDKQKHSSDCGRLHTSYTRTHKYTRAHTNRHTNTPIFGHQLPIHSLLVTGRVLYGVNGNSLWRSYIKILCLCINLTILKYTTKKKRVYTNTHAHTHSVCVYIYIFHKCIFFYNFTGVSRLPKVGGKCINSASVDAEQCILSCYC